MINKVYQILALILMLWSQPAWAQLPSIPESQSLTKEQFDSQTNEFTHEDNADKYVDFTMRVNKSWTQRTENYLKNDLYDEKKYGDIAVFLGAPNALGRARIEVVSHEINNDVYLRDWVLKWVLDRGYTVKAFDDSERNKTEITYVRYVDGVAESVHSLFEQNGTRIIQISYYAPLERASELQDFQIRTIDSFELLNFDAELPEGYKTYAFLDKRKFDYPESLKIRSSDSLSEDELKLNMGLVDNQNFLIGSYQFHIFAFKGDFNLKEEVQNLMDGYEKAGFKIQDKIENKSYEMADFMKFQKTEVYGVSRKTTDYVRYDSDPIVQELWLSIAGDGEYFYILSMMGAARDLDTYNWSRNARAIEKILTSIRRY